MGKSCRTLLGAQAQASLLSAPHSRRALRVVCHVYSVGGRPSPATCRMVRYHGADAGQALHHSPSFHSSFHLAFIPTLAIAHSFLHPMHLPISLSRYSNRRRQASDIREGGQLADCRQCLAEKSQSCVIFPVNAAHSPISGLEALEHTELS